jgi:acetylornithine/succinyldiaminopimelate/putrescine aminotransferase
MQLSHVKELEQKYILGTYARYDVLIERGSGAYLVDAANKRYLDLLAGIGVNALGYNHPRVKQVLRKQIKRPLHISNLFYHEYQGRLAEKLCKLSGLDRAFFTNSGAESIEACLKFSRAYAGRTANNGTGRKYRVLAMENAFHGRTLGALSATSNTRRAGRPGVRRALGGPPARRGDDRGGPDRHPPRRRRRGRRRLRGPDQPIPAARMID